MAYNGTFYDVNGEVGKKNFFTMLWQLTPTSPPPHLANLPMPKRKVKRKVINATWKKKVIRVKVIRGATTNRPTPILYSEQRLPASQKEMV